MRQIRSKRVLKSFQDRLQTASLQQRRGADVSKYSKQRLKRQLPGLSERELFEMIDQSMQERGAATEGNNLLDNLFQGLDKIFQGAIETLRKGFAQDMPDVPSIESAWDAMYGQTTVFQDILCAGYLSDMFRGYSSPDTLLDLLARIWRQVLCLGRHPFNFIIYKPGLKQPMLSFPVDLPGHGRFALPTTFSHSFASTANFIILVAPPLFLCYPPIKVRYHHVVCHLQCLLGHS